MQIIFKIFTIMIVKNKKKQLSFHRVIDKKDKP